MNRPPLIIGIAVLLMIAALAVPIKQRCGAPGRTCATAVDADGNIHYYYEVEPLGVFMTEHALGFDIPVYYTSGEEVVKVG
ncbi:hypothetical protein [Mycobacterium sp. 1423905.2]|uniref:hypothetical protein n=1 Tax=Mycobacterium sp. 1423905.2 TaxID=1856859 RepID=UPI000801C06C|nr:hypothetical protein [Mycobacterium sp. 1423905.2]OBJ56660.1 hypothetical protein A9W95_00135 [Mycobacterium sp. 1423905.2]